METVAFVIDGATHSVSVKGAPPFRYGSAERLSTPGTDIAYHQPWYPEGHNAAAFLSASEFRKVRAGLSDSIARIVARELGRDVTRFELSQYHKLVTSNEDHFKVVSKTRDLFPEDFNFPILDVISRFESILGFRLTDTEPRTGAKMHIIVRINRPFSTDFNPPHKDIYEGVDEHSYLPPFINFWIPICGSTQRSSLPVVPGSHLLSEDQVLRTFAGGVVEGNQYRVRMVQSWAGRNDLVRAKVDYGEVLIFTSHLIHGLAINEEPDVTRVALEFRLFKNNAN